MKQHKFYISLVMLLLFISGSINCFAKVQPADKSNVSAKIAKTHIPFIQNNGQMDKDVKFYAKTFGGTVFVTEKGEVVYSLPKKEKDKTATGVALREEFIGGKIKQVKGEEKARTKVSYFKGNNPKKWQNNITTFDLVDLGEVYAGIDLKLKAYGNNVEKLFYVTPGADPKDIGIKLKGVKGLSVNTKGELEAQTDLGSITFSKPVAYQEIEGKKKAVDVAYAVKGDKYNFAIGDYDKNNTLVIDPLLASTYIGGSLSSEHCFDIKIDGNGNVFVCGDTYSADFPTTSGAYNESFNGGDSDCFVSKLSGDLTTLIASTFFGGTELDYSIACELDTTGNIYATGITASSDFPVTGGAYDPTFNGGTFNMPDTFIIKFNNDLSEVLISTYFGGSDYEECLAMTRDDNGNIYVAGFTMSSDFPATTGAYDENCNGESFDGFIAVFSADLSTLMGSTLLGEESSCVSIRVDHTGNVFVSGSTWSPDFPVTTGAFDESFNGEFENFVAKLNSSLTSLMASTFLGNITLYSTCYLALDRNDNVFVAGATDSDVFPVTSGAYDESYNGGDSDGYIYKLNNDLTTLLASTFLGGSSGDGCDGDIIIDSCGDVYVSSSTISSDFPVTVDAYDNTYNGGSDRFVSKLDNNLSALLYSTFIGGSSDDAYMDKIALGNDGSIYITGATMSSDFPTTPGAFDETHNGGSSIYDSYEGFVAKFDNEIRSDDDDDGDDSGESGGGGGCFISIIQ